MPSTTELDVSVRGKTVLLTDIVPWYYCRHNTTFWNSSRRLLLAAAKDRKLWRGNLKTPQIHNLVPQAIFFPFLTKDLFPLLLNQIKFSNRYSAWNTKNYWEVNEPP